MSLLERLRKALGGSGEGSSGGDVYWIYARCRRCGEPLRGRVDLRNEPSLADDGETWIVRKGLIGSGLNRAEATSGLRAETASVLRCYQVIEVTLTFDAAKQHVLESEAAGGELISKEEYERLKGASSIHA
jgi:hypothetical protein